MTRVFEVEAVRCFNDWASQNGSAGARVDGWAFTQDVARASSRAWSQLTVVSHWSHVLKLGAKRVASQHDVTLADGVAKWKRSLFRDHTNGRVLVGTSRLADDFDGLDG
jgi:hypothetical protein